VTSTTPGTGATAVAVSAAVTAEFSEPVSSSALVMGLTGPGGTAVNGATALGADGRSVAFTPTAALNPSSTYTASVRATDPSGNAMAGPHTWAFTTGGAADSVPPTVTSTDPAAGATNVPLGSTVNARMSEPLAAAGVEFTVRSTGGAVVAGAPSLSADGLTVTFTPGSALAASTTYTASLRAVDRAGNAMAAPVSWSFTTMPPPDTAPPTVLSTVPEDGATGVRATDSVTAAFSEPVLADSLQMGLTGPGGAVVPGTTVLAPDGRSATFTPTAALARSTGFTASVRATDLAGNTAASPRTWRFTTAAGPDTAPPSITKTSPGKDATGVPPAGAVTVSFDEPVSSAGLQFALTGPGGAEVPGAAAVSADGRTATFTPSSALVVATTYRVSVLARDRSGNAMPTATTWSFTTAAGACPCSVLGDVTPKNADSGDGNGVELGMRVVPSVNAVVTGVRFYKSAANTGTHTGSLWTSSGQLLATGTFTGETASGWQTLTFASPVPVQAGVTYVASYLAPSGHYAADPGYFTGRSVSTGVLTAPAGTTAVGNGVFRYGGGFPTASHNDANYYVDVVVTTDGADTTPPTITSRKPAAGATQVRVDEVVTVTFSEPVNGADLGMTLTGPGGAAVVADTVLSPDGRTATLTPRSDLAPSAGYTVSVTAKDRVANAMETRTWTFTTAAAATACPCSLFRSADAPTDVANEGTPVSLGMTWIPAVDGDVTAVRFFKVAGDTGTHTGSLFSADGALLSTGTFTGETAAGWQTLQLAAPVPVTAGTGYVVAYSTAEGRFGYSRNYFSTSRSSGPLTAPADSPTAFNGRYVYAAGSPFPVSSGGGSNYWVDVVFTTQNMPPPPPSDTTAPMVAQTSPAASASGVAPTTPVTATFSEPVLADTLQVTMTGVSGTVPATVDLEPGGTRLTVRPASPLAPNASYTVSVLATDTAGNAMAGPFTWTFATADTIAPTVLSVTPAAGSRDVAATMAPTATISEAIRVDSVLAKLTTGTTTVPTGTVISGDRTVIVNPLAALAPATTYTVTLTGIADLAGNLLAAPHSWSFTTADTLAPTVVSVTPTAGARDVPVSATFTATFSEPFRVGSGLATVTTGSTQVGVTAAVSGDRAVIVTPAAPLAYTTTYTVTLTGVTDLAGNALAAPYSWSFTTAGPPPPVCPCSLFGPTESTPFLASSSGTAREVGMKFRTTVAGKIDSIRFYKALGGRGTHTGSLWSATGQRLAQVTFTNETSMGWQTAKLSQPVSVTAGTTYVVSYTAPTGRWSETTNYFSAEKVNGPLRGLANSSSANGVYGAAGSFPTTGGAGRNYWVDVVFIVP
jgi:methionine-rich copper-binding protein CopC